MFEITSETAFLSQSEYNTTSGKWGAYSFSSLYVYIRCCHLITKGPQAL